MFQQKSIRFYLILSQHVFTFMGGGGFHLPQTLLILFLGIQWFFEPKISQLKKLSIPKKHWIPKNKDIQLFHLFEPTFGWFRKGYPLQKKSQFLQFSGFRSWLLSLPHTLVCCLNVLFVGSKSDVIKKTDLGMFVSFKMKISYRFS